MIISFWFILFQNLSLLLFFKFCVICFAFPNSDAVEYLHCIYWGAYLAGFHVWLILVVIFLCVFYRCFSVIWIYFKCSEIPCSSVLHLVGTRNLILVATFFGYIYLGLCEVLVRQTFHIKVLPLLRLGSF